MKKLVITTALVSAALLSTASAQLAINEVLVDPIGPDTGKQIVEIINVTKSAFTPTGWFICAPLTYSPLPAIAIPAGGIVRIHLFASGTNTATDFFVPFFRTLRKADTFQLFKSSFFNNSNDIVDFVSWGGGNLRIGQAVSIKQWPSNTATVTLPTVEGQTIAWRGAGDSNTDWFRDATPTLGQPNGILPVTALGTGCKTNSAIPTITFPSPAVDGNLDFRATVSGGPAKALVIYLIGSKPTGGLPILGSSLEVLPDILNLTLPIKDFPLPLFIKNVKFTGFTLYFQAAVIDLGAPNGLFGMTRGAKVDIG